MTTLRYKVLSSFSLPEKPKVLFKRVEAKHSQLFVAAVIITVKNNLKKEDTMINDHEELTIGSPTAISSSGVKIPTSMYVLVPLISLFTTYSHLRVILPCHGNRDWDSPSVILKEALALGGDAGAAAGGEDDRGTLHGSSSSSSVGNGWGQQIFAIIDSPGGGLATNGSTGDMMALASASSSGRLTGRRSVTSGIAALSGSGLGTGSSTAARFFSDSPSILKKKGGGGSINSLGNNTPSHTYFPLSYSRNIPLYTVDIPDDGTSSQKTSSVNSTTGNTATDNTPSITHPLITHPLITHPLIIHPLIIHPLIIHLLITHPLITHPLTTNLLIKHPLITHIPTRHRIPRIFRSR